MPGPEKVFPQSAFVAAAGLGTRMRPLTDSTPKPLLRVAGRSLLERLLDTLAAGGIRHCIVNLHHLGDQIRSHIEARQQPLPAVTFSDESGLLLETGGGVCKALEHLGPDPFVVANSDVVWIEAGENCLRRLGRHWDSQSMDALLLLVPGERTVGYDGTGDFLIDDRGRLRRAKAGADDALVFGGLQILHPRLFAGLQATPFSLNRIYDRAGRAGRLYGLVHDGRWLHVGTAEALALADSTLAKAAP